MATFDAEKVPVGVLDYQVDWAGWLAIAETIAVSTWTTSPGIVVDSSLSTTTSATVFVSGGTQGNPYDLTNTITTSAGRVDSRTITIRVVAQRKVS